MTSPDPGAITEVMDDDQIIADLRRAGTEPVPPAVEQAHLSAMAATAVGPAPRRFGRVALAGAAIIGFVVGSAGFAVAGALPDPAQDVAHDVLAVVRVEVPEGAEGKRGPCVSAVATSDLSKTEKKAAKAECPKGPPGLDDAADDQGQGGGRSDDAGPPEGSGPEVHADDPCRGRPPWAGRPDLSQAEKDALKADRKATCDRGDDRDRDEDEDGTDDDGG